MYPTVADLMLLLSAYFPRSMSVQRMLYALGSILMLHTLVRLNRNQRRLPHQPPQTGWEKELRELIRQAFHPEEALVADWEGDPPTPRVIEAAINGLLDFLNMLNWDLGDIASKFTISLPIFLCTTRTQCIYCPGQVPLMKHEDIINVPVLGADLRWTKGHLVVAICRQCRAIYHVDHITRREGPNTSKRIQILECDALYLRFSKTERLWVHRKFAKAQESAVFQFKASWLGFSDFLNHGFLGDSLSVSGPKMHKLFVEHFACRLIVAHSLKHTFTCAPDPRPDHLTIALLSHIGRDCGLVPGGMEHACQNCTHRKQYCSDNVANAAIQQMPAHALAEHEEPGDNVV